MDMSAAAIAPQQPTIREQDTKHPMFPMYRQYRTSMNILMVEASSFEDWHRQYETSRRNDEFCKHERYPEFLAWMRATKAGARKCPIPGAAFPANFQFWLDGGRW